LESEEVRSEEVTDMHVSRGCCVAGRERQTERVCVKGKGNVWKSLADTKYLRES